MLAGVADSLAMRREDETVNDFCFPLLFPGKYFNLYLLLGNSVDEVLIMLNK